MTHNSEIIHQHFDCHPGLTMEGVAFEERTQPDGTTKYWRASSPIGTIFGSEVEGECEGFGATKEQALERLNADIRKLHEILWL